MHEVQERETATERDGSKSKARDADGEEFASNAAPNLAGVSRVTHSTKISPGEPKFFRG